MVKCAECGFLTLRDRLSGELIEVPDDYRVSGRVPADVAYRGVHNYPICFVMAWNLFPEVEQAALQQVTDNSSDWGPYVSDIITRDRLCPPNGKELGFTNYQQGFTPKEHLENLDRQRMLQWQAEREEADRSWRERQRREDRKWWLVLALVAGLFTLLGVFVGNLLN